MTKKNCILAVIPARGGSKGIPGKNIKLLGGRPLISYAVRLAKAAEDKKIITDHIVSTDSSKIARIARRYGANVPFLRPKKIAGDRSLVIHTVIHAVLWWEMTHKRKVHSVLLLQPTHPLTTVRDVETALRLYTAGQPDAKCLISICDAQNIRLSTLYYKRGLRLEQVVKGIKPTTRRQDQRSTYWRNGGIYITRRDLLLKAHKIIDGHPLFYEMPRSRSIDLDDMFDWMVAECLLRHYWEGE